jgi:AGZA family xanthine/uracil permease-like MFS transporter
MQSYFDYRNNGTDLRTEILAGITTFLSAMYIIVVNPAIVSKTGMPFGGVLTATILVSALSSIAMGLYARTPILVAPGMGLNAFFTYSVVLGMGVKWETALGAVAWSGVIFMLLSIFNIRTLIVRAIPRQIRYALAAGIGLFISFIGFTNAKFVVANPATLVSINKMDPILVTFLVGLALTSVLVIKRTKGALIIGIVFTTIIAIPIGRLWGNASAINFGVPTLVTWQGLASLPDFSLIGRLDVVGSLKLAMWPVIFAFVFTDMFDSISTFIGVSEAANLIDENGDPRNIKQALIVDAFATGSAGFLGSSPGTSYIESATGVKEGGRTGMTAVVAGLLFLPFMFLSPLLSIVPAIATSPALILVGVFMIRPVLKINWDKLDDAIPAFLGMLLIPLTYSITQGIVWSFLSWTVIKLLLRKWNDLSVMLLVIDVFAILALVLH